MQKISILLIDDHSLVRAGIRDFLSRATHIQVIGEAESGRQAQELINHSPPDMVLLDIEMPEINGIELTEWIRDSHPQIKIMILSSYDDDEYVMTALKAGANGYSLKNTSPRKLIDGIDAIANGQAFLDPSIATKVMSFITTERDADYSLTKREQQIIELLSLGKTNKEIGEALFISNRTVQGHLSKIFAKLEVDTRTEAVVKSAKMGFISINKYG